MIWIIVLVGGVLLLGLLYWLLVVTEGVFLGQRMVVWLYDLTAHRYDGIKQFDAVAEEFFVVRPLLNRLTHLPSPRILDVATGAGRLPWFVLNAPTFHGRITGLDASARMLAQAAPKLRPFGDRASLVWGTAVALPFSANHFDAVTCLEALEFFPSETAALSEMLRVLKPGGLLLITRRRGQEAKAFLRRYRNAAQFEALLTSVGFVQVTIYPWQVDYDQAFAYKS